MTLSPEAPAVARPLPRPGVIAPYGHAWRQMWIFFLELLLVSVVAFLVSIPSLGLSVKEVGDFVGEHFSLSFFLVRFEGPFGYLLFALAYVILLEWPIEYGVAYVFLLAARGDPVKVKRMLVVFKNYSNAVLANILVATVIVIGFVFLIVPGIVFGCKLAFVPYLIVERKMDAVGAIKESWRMTRGHAWKVFWMGVLAIFIALLGLVVLGVGILVSIIWIRLASATLYASVCPSVGETEEPPGSD